MSNNSIKGLPMLGNDFTLGYLGDPESNYATSKRWIRENFATSADADKKLAKTGGTMTGDIVLQGAPTLPLHPATKLYTD